MDDKHVYLSKKKNEVVNVELLYSIFDESWYARAEVKGKEVSRMTAKLMLFNTKNEEVCTTEDKDGQIKGENTIFVWKIKDSDLSKMNDRALRPTIEFTDPALGVNKVKSVRDDEITVKTFVYNDRSNAWNAKIGDIPLLPGKRADVSKLATEITFAPSFKDYVTLFDTNTIEAVYGKKVKYYIVKNGQAVPTVLPDVEADSSGKYTLSLSGLSLEPEKEYTVKLMVGYALKSRSAVHTILKSGTKEVTFSFKTGK